MPAAITSANRDVQVSIDLAAGSIAKVKAADIGVKTDITTKSLFEQHPNADKLLVMQMLASTYCSLLSKSTDLTTQQREQSWSKFQERLLTYSLPQPGPTSANSQVELLRAVLQPLYFERGSTVLLQESQQRLGQYAQRLKDLQVTGIVVEGHTQPVNVQPNINISKARAEAVKRALVKLGVDEAKIQAVGLGGSQPVALGVEGYNSRVVIRIVP
jgi:outer membrane protein OmpA-like peptidoglycan-associated protein